MKKYLLIALGVLFAETAMGQTMHTLWVRSNPANTQCRFTQGYCACPSSQETFIQAAIWTIGGSPYYWHTFLNFDLSSIPATATIDSAFLSFWADPTAGSGNPGNPTWGTDNAAGIYRLVDAWDTATVTWSLQPGFSYTHGDTLAQSTSTTENYLKNDVTKMVQDMFSSGGKYGFILKELQETTVLNSMIFYSPYEYATDTSVTPLLVVKYTPNTTGINNINSVRPVVNVYPNPSAGILHIDNSGGEGSTIQILSVNGQILFSRVLSVKDVVDVSVFPDGVYFYTISDPAGYNVQRGKVSVVH